MSEITLSIDSEIAEFYEQISEEERAYITELVVKELRRSRAMRAMSVVKETSELAKSRGLTPEILEDLLREDETPNT